ncbi:hypothetical protein A4A49_61493, partial [Nicotiana attenuata]
VIFSETIPFFYAPPVSTSQGEEDEWIVYQVTRTLTEQSDDVPPSPSSSIEHQSTIVLLAPSPIVFEGPPIVQVYSRRQETNDTCLTPVRSSSNPLLPDPPENLGLPIDLRKGTRTSKSTYFIFTFVSYDHLCNNSAGRFEYFSRVP